MIPEEIDLDELRRQLAERLRGAAPRGYVRGKGDLRVAVVAILKCSEAEAEQLRANGIEPRHDLPGVGKNLQDHLQARLVFKCNEPTLNDEVRSLCGQDDLGGCLPDDPELAARWEYFSYTTTIPSDPPGATAWRRPYDEPPRSTVR